MYQQQIKLVNVLATVEASLLCTSNSWSFFLFQQKLKLSLCTINSKIYGTPKGVYLPISKLHSILAVVNLLAHNNLTISWHNHKFLWASKFATAKIERSFERGK